MTSSDIIGEDWTMVANNAGATTLGGCTGKGFLPGQSGNIHGRPSINRERRALFDAAIPDGDWAVMVAKQAAKAKRGDSRAFELLMAYQFGKPKGDDDLTLHVGPSAEAVVLAFAEARRLLAVEVAGD